MKTRVRWFSVLMMCGALALPGSGPALGEQPRPYAWVDAGGVVMNDTHLTSLFEPLTGVKVGFDPGFRFGVGGGVEFNRFVAAELESGFTYNNINSITGAHFDDASIYQTPILVNLMLQAPIELRNRTRLVPMIGGGVGGASVVLDCDFISIQTPQGATATAQGTFYDFVFAYQGRAGLRFDFNRNMSVGVYYRYFVADAPSWEPDFIEFIGVPPPSNRISMEALHSHQVTLGFTWIF